MASELRVEVKGLDELMAKFRKAEGDLDQQLKKALLEAGKPVADDARGRLSRYSTRSAAGIRARLTSGTRVRVEQRLSKTTGNRGDWGALQMRRALVPALAAKRPEVEHKVDQAVADLIRKSDL